MYNVLAKKDPNFFKKLPKTPLKPIQVTFLNLLMFELEFLLGNPCPRHHKYKWRTPKKS